MKMKTILVFVNNELYKQISYKSKRAAKGNYLIFQKNGILNPLNGEKIENAKFELI